MAQQNILLIVLDQMRADWSTLNGIQINTPNIDRLRQKGVNFTNCLTPSSMCAPARACLASGRNYETCGVADNTVDFPYWAIPTFYQSLQSLGYNTYDFGKDDLNKNSGLCGIDGSYLLGPLGFTGGVRTGGKWEEYSQGNSGSTNNPYTPMLQKAGFLKAFLTDYQKRGQFPSDYPNVWPSPLTGNYYLDNYIGNAATKQLANIPTGKPWFMQVNFAGPHEPLDMLSTMQPSVLGKTYPLPSNINPYSSAQHQAIRQAYTGLIQQIDTLIGGLFNALKGRGTAEQQNTTIIFTADHGEQLYDHAVWGKGYYWQQCCQVPLIIASPGGMSNMTCSGPVSMMDIAATCLDVAGWFGSNLPPKKSDGGVSQLARRDFLGMLSARALSSLVSQRQWNESISLMPSIINSTVNTRTSVHCSYSPFQFDFDGRYKTGGAIPGTTPFSFKYDLLSDPWETKNLAS